MPQISAANTGNTFCRIRFAFIVLAPHSLPWYNFEQRFHGARAVCHVQRAAIKKYFSIEVTKWQGFPGNSIWEIPWTSPGRLLGTYLVRQLGQTVLVGRITETEAYIGRCDKACHAYGYHKTPRNAPMFLGPGHAYIYLIYGMHHCLNLVTEPEGEPAAVLIRALEPVAGTETIRRLRYGDKPMTPYRTAHLLDGARQGLPGTGSDHGRKTAWT